MDSEIEFLQGQRGNDILKYGEFLYNKDYNLNTSTRWRCINRSCKGAVFLNQDNTIERTVEHNHPPNPEIIQKKKAMIQIKERATTTTESHFDIISNEIQALSESDDVDVAELYSVDYLRDQIRRTRNNLLGFISGGVVDIPDLLKVDSKGNDFLRYDSSYEDEDRIIILIGEYKKKLIPKVKTFIIDGTFKSSPQGFYQLLVLHGQIVGKTYPMIYILLKNKSESTYIKAFNKCKELVTMNVKFIVTDFERALINAIRAVFSDAEYHGCLFHLGQAAWRRVQAQGDVVHYKNDESFKLAFKMMLCLAFVPSHDVLVFYEDIQKFVAYTNCESILKFQQYFEHNYLEFNLNKTDRVGNYHSPINFWNAFSRVKKLIPRTSNNAESWNRTLNLRMGTSSPNIAQFISTLLKCEEMDIYNLKRTRKGRFEINYNKREDNIRYLIDSYDIFPREDYMAAILKAVYFKFEKDDN
jgi:hypothetical protein